MIISIFFANPEYAGYIAGSGDGIVTVRGLPAQRIVYLYLVARGVSPMVVVSHQLSLTNGHYLFTGLDPAKEYLVMVRDYKKELEPFAWDFVKPADDLTIVEQQALWATWQ